jgi:ATP-dependent Clp protease ATP-binding subunit ClpX
MKRSDSAEVLRCSFCNKQQDAVQSLISSPAVPPSYICDECIAVCNSILTDEQRSPGKSHRLMNRLQRAIRSIFGHQRTQTAGQA